MLYEPHSGHLLEVWTHKNHRRKGVGTAAMRKALEDIRAKSPHLKEAFLWVAASNTGAIRMYEKLGFDRKTESDGEGHGHYLKMSRPFE